MVIVGADGKMNGDASLKPSACALAGVGNSTENVHRGHPGRLTDRDIYFTFRDIVGYGQ